ncbi:MAG TPA: acetyl-CoA carboxylase biotin carboxylase subunit [Epulopiscium sp.]|nr:acetyl-CoA carboxylase biotin carboxylase subunit [Candidatus Epulonipiscium sp.]
MFEKVLIANRGEIAVRIIRACREMGIQTVAVYSTADKEALHVKMADEAVCIGSPLPRDSYLNMENIISAAIGTGAEAIHPGFGFLSENAKFARICESCNIKFIGPVAEMIDNMGDKSKAREMMIKAGVPVVPGSEGVIDNLDKSKEIALEIGYPVIIKASSGGGGRGMRVVWDESELEKSISAAKAESKGAFGDDAVYMEKYIVNPRHIEFQIMGDEHGNIVHLGERDCSLQRRHQKMIEEAPSPVITQEQRIRMGSDAVKAARSVDYSNAGTIEFIMDPEGNYYFIEMNTRIQVEHPVTELVTGMDLVREQIRVAAGEKLSFTQDDISITGHSIECRINAENPLFNFRPCAGSISGLHLPGGRNVRVETAIYDGYCVPHTYDSMLVKIITYGKDRQEAIDVMRRALGETQIGGIDTNIDFQYQLIHTPQFETGEFDTSFIERELTSIMSGMEVDK